jgi:hypothetical protein
MLDRGWQLPKSYRVSANSPSVQTCQLGPPKLFERRVRHWHRGDGLFMVKAAPKSNRGCDDDGASYKDAHKSAPLFTPSILDTIIKVSPAGDYDISDTRRLNRQGLPSDADQSPFRVWPPAHDGARQKEAPCLGRAGLLFLIAVTTASLIIARMLDGADLETIAQW